jgi:hypothetical protein
MLLFLPNTKPKVRLWVVSRMNISTAVRQLLGLVLIIVLLALPCAAIAAPHRMECREWTGAGDYIGSYVFSFDPGTKSLSIEYRPEGLLWRESKINPLFGAKVKHWNLVWQKGLDAVFYGIADSATDPVKLLTLRFSSAKMFDYTTGGLYDPMPSLTRKECQRLD